MESSLSCRAFAQVATVLLLIFQFHYVTASSAAPQKDLRKVLIQSSNNATFSFISLPDDADQQPETNEQTDSRSNETWKSTGFQIRNITTLLSEFPQVLHSLPFKNSSRFLSSQTTAASLTISLESFKHGLMFLNFSYFIGKISEPLATNALLNSSTDSATVGKYSSSFTNDKEIHGMSNATVHSSPNAELSKPKTSFTSAESNKASLPISPSSPSESKMSEAIVLINPRQRRSVSSDTFSSEISVTLSPPSVPDGDPNSDNNEPAEMPETTTETSEDETQNSVVPESTDIKNLTTAAAVDSLSLVEAVEMLKSAAAAIKDSVAKTDTVSDSNGPKSRPSISSDDAINVIGTEDKTEEVTEKSFQDAPSQAKLKITLPVSRKQKAEVEQTHHSHRNKYKNGDGNEALKGRSKKRNGKEKNADSPEPTKKDKRSSDEDRVNDHYRLSSSSSSSEELVTEYRIKKEEENPKISYKMWRASLEKKNRPPGLYVTVNDDIIFDNWEGLWDKNFLLGKWSGSKWKVSENGKSRWNQTSVFLNWDGQTVGRDVKITFEWEPVENLELVLSDIEISTLLPKHEDTCTTTGATTASSERVTVLETDSKLMTELQKLSNSTEKSNIVSVSNNVTQSNDVAAITKEKKQDPVKIVPTTDSSVLKATMKVTTVASLDTTTKYVLHESVEPTSSPDVGTTGTSKFSNGTKDESDGSVIPSKNETKGDIASVNQRVTPATDQTLKPITSTERSSEGKSFKGIGNPEELLQRILITLNGNIQQSTTPSSMKISDLLPTNSDDIRKKIMEANLTSLLMDLKGALLESMSSPNANRTLNDATTTSPVNTISFPPQSTTTTPISVSTNTSLPTSSTPGLSFSPSANVTEQIISTGPSHASTPSKEVSYITSMKPTAEASVQTVTIPSVTTISSNPTLNQGSTDTSRPAIVSRQSPFGRRIQPRKTDSETAILVCVLTGGIALVILIMILKKRFDITTKGRNATR